MEMAVVNPMLSPIVYQTASTPSAAANVKDSRWLTLDVCREFTRNKCSRTDDECRFAHPPPNVEVQNGRVMCCFDSIKGKCQRREPPCKYLHPPQHLKEQLLQNGRNNLILKHLQMQMMAHAVPGVYPIMYDLNTGKSFPTSYIPLGQESYVVPRYYVPVSGGTPCYSPYYAAAPAAPTYTANPPPSTGSATDGSCIQSQQLMLNAEQQNVDRTENGGMTAVTTACGTQNGVPCSSPVWHSAPSPVDATVTGANYSSPVYFQTSGGMTGAGMVPLFKSTGQDCGKGGVPFYQPAAVAYQQMALAATMQLQQPTYVPITITGQPPIDPRY